MKRWTMLGLAALAGCATERGSTAAAHDASAEVDPPAAVTLTSWEVAETNGAGTLAQWTELSESDGHAGVRVATENAEQTFNLLVSTSSYGPDVHLLGLVRADSGEEDQGGGFAWRLRDATNYYCARWNPLEGNLRIYHVIEGKRTKLASVDVKVDPTAWHSMEVQMVGPAIRVALDDHELTAADSTFASAGKVGLWTKADASTSFGEVEVRTVPGSTSTRPR